MFAGLGNISVPVTYTSSLWSSHFKHNVTAIECRHGDVKPVTVKVQVLCHTEYSRIAGICPAAPIRIKSQYTQSGQLTDQ